MIVDDNTKGLGDLTDLIESNRKNNIRETKDSFPMNTQTYELLNKHASKIINSRFGE